MEDTIEKYLTWAKWANETGPVEDWMDIDLLRDRLENEDLDKHPNAKKGDRLYIKAAARAANVIALYEREKWWYYIPMKFQLVATLLINYQIILEILLFTFTIKRKNENKFPSGVHYGRTGKKAKLLSKADIKRMTLLYSMSQLSREEAIILLMAKYHLSEEEAADSYLTAELEKGKIRNNLA